MIDGTFDICWDGKPCLPQNLSTFDYWDGTPSWTIQGPSVFALHAISTTIGTCVGFSEALHDSGVTVVTAIGVGEGYVQVPAGAVFELFGDPVTLISTVLSDTARARRRFISDPSTLVSNSVAYHEALHHGFAPAKAKGSRITPIWLGADDFTLTVYPTSGNTLFLDRFLAGRSALVKTINVWCSDVGNVKVAVYSDIAAAPGVLVHSTGGNSVVAGWNSIPITAFAVASGTYYWIALNSDATIVNAPSIPGGGRARWYQLSVPYATAFPDPAGGGYSAQSTFENQVFASGIQFSSLFEGETSVSSAVGSCLCSLELLHEETATSVATSSVIAVPLEAAHEYSSIVTLVETVPISTALFKLELSSYALTAVSTSIIVAIKSQTENSIVMHSVGVLSSTLEALHHGTAKSSAHGYCPFDQIIRPQQIRWNATLGKLLVQNDNGASDTQLRNADLSLSDRFYIQYFRYGIDADTTNIYVSQNHPTGGSVKKLNNANYSQVATTGTLASLQFIDAAGDPNYIYVTSDYNTDGHGIRKISKSDMTTSASILSTGTGDGQFTNPRGVCYYNGYVYVCDNPAGGTSGRVVKLNASGSGLTFDSNIPVTLIGTGVSGHYDLCTDGTNWYLTTGNFIGKFGMDFTPISISSFKAGQGFSITIVPDQGDGNGQTLAVTPYGVYADCIRRYKCSDLSLINTVGGLNNASGYIKANHNSSSIVETTSELLSTQIIAHNSGVSVLSAVTSVNALEYRLCAGYCIVDSITHVGIHMTGTQNLTADSMILIGEGIAGLRGTWRSTGATTSSVLSTQIFRRSLIIDRYAKCTVVGSEVVFLEETHRSSITFTTVLKTNVYLKAIHKVPIIVYFSGKCVSNGKRSARYNPTAITAKSETLGTFASIEEDITTRVYLVTSANATLELIRKSSAKSSLKSTVREYLCASHEVQTSIVSIVYSSARHTKTLHECNPTILQAAGNYRLVPLRNARTLRKTVVQVLAGTNVVLERTREIKTTYSLLSRITLYEEAASRKSVITTSVTRVTSFKHSRCEFNGISVIHGTVEDSLRLAKKFKSVVPVTSSVVASRKSNAKMNSIVRLYDSILAYRKTALEVGSTSSASTHTTITLLKSALERYAQSAAVGDVNALPRNARDAGKSIARLMCSVVDYLEANHKCIRNVSGASCDMNILRKEVIREVSAKLRTITSSRLSGEYIRELAAISRILSYVRLYSRSKREYGTTSTLMSSVTNSEFLCNKEIIIRFTSEAIMNTLMESILEFNSSGLVVRGALSTSGSYTRYLEFMAEMQALVNTRSSSGRIFELYEFNCRHTPRPLVIS